MIAVSAKFLAALQYSHTSCARMEVYSNGSLRYTLTNILGKTDPNFPATKNMIIDGSVNYDKKSDVRARCSVKLVTPDGSLIPKLSSDLLTPFGNIIKLYRGIQFADGRQEFIILGTFRITDVEVDEDKGGVTVTVTGSDLTHIVARNTVVQYWPSGATSDTSSQAYATLNAYYTDIIRLMVQDRYPTVTFNDIAANWQLLQIDASVKSDPNVPVYQNEGSNLWSTAKTYAKTVGCDLSFNRYGLCQLKTDPNYSIFASGVTPSPAFTFIEGQQALFTALKRTLTDSATFNQVIITGEGQTFGGLPLQSAPAQDNDPSSPTYINGSYGVVTYFETNSYLVSQIQADHYAALVLRISLGVQETLEFPSIVCPFLEVDDVIALTCLRLGVNANIYIIDSLTIPLKATDSMKAVVRRRRALV